MSNALWRLIAIGQVSGIPKIDKALVGERFSNGLGHGHPANS